MADRWHREEVELLVADYFEMLGHELAGVAYSKTDHRGRLRTLMPDRSDSSIEFKHANVSAVLIELGFPFIEGYKPRFNYQGLLGEVVETRLRESAELERLAAADAVAVPSLEEHDVLSALVSPPRRRQLRESPRTYAANPLRLGVDYLEIEARNHRLGRLGEEFVLSFERARLERAGHGRLAAKVEHVAVTRGDGAGFDILSYETSGRERFVEVKTTKYGAETPFLVSRNEVEVSERVATQFHLYRVFSMRKRARLFTLQGSLRMTCQLDATLYMGRVA